MYATYLNDLAPLNKNKNLNMIRMMFIFLIIIFAIDLMAYET